jgi:SAM-dependent methyltransferase
MGEKTATKEQQSIALQPTNDESQLDKLRNDRKKSEIDYWNKNLWKWRYYVWILRKMRKFGKRPNEADDRVCRELELICEASDRPINVLDLCCGDGSSLTKRLLKNKKINIIGIDISRECAKSSPPLRALGFDCIASDCEFSPIKSEAVDAAIIRNSLHHLTNLTRLAKEMGRVLRDESPLFIIEVETKSSISNFVYHRILGEPNYPFIAQEEIVSCLEKGAFSVNNVASLKVASRRSFFISAVKGKV